MKLWLRNGSYFWEEAPFFRILLPFTSAIVAYEYQLLPSAGASTLLLLFAVLTLLTAGTRFLNSGRSSAITLFVLIHSAFFVSGWSLCAVHDIRDDPAWFGKHVSRAQVFQVSVLEAPALREKTWKLKVAVNGVWGNNRLQRTTGSALLYIYRDSVKFPIRQGSIIVVPNKWQAIKSPGNPFEFDYAGFCHRNNIYYQQFLSKKDMVFLPAPPGQVSFIDKVHFQASLALSEHISDSSVLGLMQAMLLGDEVNFDDDLRQSYADTGIVHIVAISGSHIMIFFQLIAVLFFWLRGRRFEPFKYLVALPLVCFYVAVAGAPASAVRAAIMFCLVALGMVLQKDKQPVNQLFATVFLMLLYEPMWLFSVGFQLSCGAVLSLILFYRPVYGLLAPSNLLLKKLWQAIAASMAAEILIAPVVIYYYHLLPITFLIANVFAYLFMGFILVLGMLLMLLGKAAIIAAALAWLITELTGAFNAVVRIFQGFNPAAFKHLYLSLPELVAVFLVITGLAVFLLRKESKGLIVALAAACVLLCGWTFRQWRLLHREEFIIYNTGRGAYAEFLEGRYYRPVFADTGFNADRDFATKEMHIANHAWHEGKPLVTDVLTIGRRNILILGHPPALDTNAVIPVDYLVINYPLKSFNAPDLKKGFPFKELIVCGDQKRYIARNWRDSCIKHSIPAHFTLFDGAFVLNKSLN